MKRDLAKKRTIDNPFKLSKDDKAVLHQLSIIVESVARTLGDSCEVVLHSLEDLSHSVVAIAHGHVTGRNLGSPMTDLGVEILREANSSNKDVIGSYYSKLPDGRILKSVTSLIKNTQGKPIGVFCINVDLSVPFLDFMKGFLPESTQDIVEHFPATMEELVSTTLEIAMHRVSGLSNISPSDRNRMIVAQLYEKGIFKVTGAIDIVAKKIGVSRYSVYNYIREAKVEAEEGTSINSGNCETEWRYNDG